MKNQRGALTLDFLFALVLVLSMTILLGVFSFTLSTIEGIQYLVFSTSRAYFAGDLNPDAQKQAALQQYDKLSKTNSYKSLLKKDWYTITLDDSSIGNFASTYSSSNPKDIFEGVRASVIVKTLSMSIPFFGGTGDQANQTYITSFLGREPTTQECMGVIEKRFQAILGLGNYSGSNINQSAYVVFDDNGC